MSQILKFNKLTEKYSVLVIGSDGLFDYLKIDEISDIVWQERNKPANEVAQKLVQTSIKKWKEVDCIVDDWTWVVIYLIFKKCGKNLISTPLNTLEPIWLKFNT